MEPIKIVIKNNLNMIPAVQATARAYGKLLEFSDQECFNIEVAV